MVWFFLKGAILGFSLAAPVGPVGLLCIRRSIYNGQRHGFITGLGAATADTFYGAVAAFGLTWISAWLITYVGYLQFFGGFLLAYVAIRILVKKNPGRELKSESKSVFQSYCSTVAITASNPATVLTFIGIFTLLNLGVNNYSDASSMTVGVFLGSAAWWLFLSWITSRYHSLLSHKTIHRINFGSGVALMGFAVFAVIRGAHVLWFT